MIHDSEMLPFFKRMVDRVVTALLEIKEGKKKPQSILYEEIAKF